MNIAAMMSAVGALSQSNPLVKQVVDSLFSTMSQNPAAVQDISQAIEKIAGMKNLSVQELISSGGLGRAMLEKFTAGKVLPEAKETELQSMVCDQCGFVHYQVVETIKPSPMSMLQGIAKAS